LTIPFEGSPFLITLARKLKELAETQHLGDILTRVRNEICERDFEGKKQLTQVTTTLRKDIHLFVSGVNPIKFKTVYNFIKKELSESRMTSHVTCAKMHIVKLR